MPYLTKGNKYLVFCVYTVKSPSGKVYVGMTQDFSARCKQHLQSTKRAKTPFGAAIRKYGASLVFTPAGEYQTREAAAEAEQRLVQVMNCIVPYGYNVSKGGEGRTVKHTDATKERIRVKQVARYKKYFDTGGYYPRKDLWKRPVVCSNGIYYCNSRAAADALGLHSQSIERVCWGKLKTTGGYTFSFIYPGRA